MASMIVRKPRGITARLRAAKARKDRSYASAVRDEVMARDGFCRYGYVPPQDRSDCAGVSEWAHIEGRYKTRGMKPEKRHSTRGTLMLCSAHHRAHHAKTLVIEAPSPKGCDGRLVFREGANRTAETLFWADWI